MQIGALYLPVAALLLWGLWATVIKYGAIETSPAATALTVNLAAAPLYVAYAAMDGQQLVPETSRALGALLLAGVFYGLGSLAYYAALSRGVDVSVATPVTALYFVVPVVLAFLVLPESLTAQEVAGVIAAVVAVVLLT